MDSLTKLRKSLKKHTQGTGSGLYGIDFQKKFNIYLAQPCLPGELCLFRLKIVGGESGTKYLFTQPRYLRNRNAPLAKII